MLSALPNCCLVPRMKNSVLLSFRHSMLTVIHRRISSIPFSSCSTYISFAPSTVGLNVKEAKTHFGIFFI